MAPDALDTGDLDVLYQEWERLRGAHDPTCRRRFVELTVELSCRAAGLFADIAVPVLGRCPDCGSARKLATPTGFMPSHDAGGEHCPGSVKRPERILAGDELVEAILDQETNARGEF